MPEEFDDGLPEIEEPGPPHPFIELTERHQGEDAPDFSRVTMRLSMVRERSMEEGEVFPALQFEGCEIPIDHTDPAYIMPDMKVSRVLHEVDTGWIRSPTIVAISNKTRWKGAVNPSQDQKDEIKKQVLLVAFNDVVCLRITPGKTQPLLLASDVRLSVCAEYGSPVMSIFAV